MPERPIVTQDMINLYGEYTHITLYRRAYMAKLTALVGSTAAAVGVTSLIEANRASAQIVKPNDAHVKAERVTYPGEGGDMSGYLYEGAQHAFNNDTSAARYNKAAADLAWSRTVDMFKQVLA